MSPCQCDHTNDQEAEVIIDVAQTQELKGVQVIMIRQGSNGLEVLEHQW